MSKENQIVEYLKANRTYCRALCTTAKLDGNSNDAIKYHHYAEMTDIILRNISMGNLDEFTQELLNKASAENEK